MTDCSRSRAELQQIRANLPKRNPRSHIWPLPKGEPARTLEQLRRQQDRHAPRDLLITHPTDDHGYPDDIGIILREIAESGVSISLTANGSVAAERIDGTIPRSTRRIIVEYAADLADQLNRYRPCRFASSRPTVFAGDDTRVRCGVCHRALRKRTFQSPTPNRTKP